MARVIPDRMNRYLWWLTLVIGFAVVLSGPITGAIVYRALYNSPVLMTLAWLWGINTIALTIALLVGAAVLSRMTRSLAAVEAIVFAVGLSILGALLRVGIIWLTGNGPLPEMGGGFFAVQFALGILVIAAILGAILYASSRERVITDMFARLERAQANLAHEEESVRAEVFDQLHGSLQAEFVAVRRSLMHVAETTSDPAAARAAAEADAHLDRIYREGVGAVARALRPAGIEAGIVVALAELQGRIGRGAELVVTIDPVVAVMDDPMTGGLHDDVRMAAFRIVEEAVSNAMRHAKAGEIDIQVTSALHDGMPVLVLRIDNAASPCRFTPGAGVSRMEARARALGGRLDIRRESGHFTVLATLPLVRPDAGRLITVSPDRSHS